MSTAKEFSHPLLWTVGLVVAAGGLGWAFFHFMGVGRSAGRDLGELTFAAKAPQAIDHLALIADRSPAVIERGRQLYSSNCTSCHGPDGDRNMTGSSPAPRNLRTEAYQAEWGGGPYGFYLTLSKGWGQGMPGFSTLTAADRYAIAHFVRESWQKGQPNYVAADAPAIAAQIPKAVAAAEGPRVPPELVQQNPRLHPLMAAVAGQTEAKLADARAWLLAVQVAAAEQGLFARVAAAAERSPGWLFALQAAAQAGDKPRLVALLVAAESGDPSLALARGASLELIAQLLIQAAAQGS